MPAYLISSAVAGIVAQRMVRLVCNTCRVLVTLPLRAQEAYATELGETRERFFEGTGCNACTDGYLGRTGVFEILSMSDTLRQLFLGRRSPLSAFGTGNERRDGGFAP